MRSSLRLASALLLASLLPLAACDDPAGGGEAPVVVTGRFTEVAAGIGHACAIDDEGAAWCWGNADFGMLGVEQVLPAETPVAVPGGVRFTRPSLGLYHSCGWTATGAAYCWGSEERGQLGTDDRPGGVFPLPGRVVGTMSWATISAGAAHTCGLTTGGEAFCWGDNIGGVLGTTLADRSYVPFTVSGGRAYRALSAGYNHTCALDADGRAWCWGANQRGQVGTAEPMETCPFGGGAHVACSRTPRAAAGGRTFASLDAGGDQTCALTAAGETYCWGGPPAALPNVSTPTRLQGPRFARVDVGFSHACGLTERGEAYCWGSNWEGQLGIGNYAHDSDQNPYRNVPVKVSGGHRFRSIAAGAGFTCGVTLEGQALCWGGARRALGTGLMGSVCGDSFFCIAVPTPVVDPLRA